MSFAPGFWLGLNLLPCSRLAWFAARNSGHILRREDDHPVFHILFQNRRLDERRPVGKRPRVGRARMTWFQAVLRVFSSHGYFASDLNELAQLDESQFRKLFRKSPIKRIGRNRFVRNVLYAIGNSGDMKFEKTLFLLSNDYDPTVAEAAFWAIKEIKANVNK